MQKVSAYQCAVAAVRPETPVCEVADEMDAQSVGSVLVQGEDGAVVGIVTDRDLLRRVVAAGRDAEKTTAADVMSRDVATCDSHQTLDEATEIMRQRAVRRLPVMKDGEVIGVVALDDIVAGLNTSLWNVTDAVRVETREARRTAGRRRRREELDQAFEDLRSQLVHLGAETAEYVGREASDLLRRLRRKSD